MDPWLESIALRAAGHGLNLIGAVPVARYDALVPATAAAAPADARARSIIVLGNGGGAFWDGFRRHLAAVPQWSQRADPLDEYTRHVVENLIAQTVVRDGIHCTPLYPFVNEPRTLRFLELGRLAGIGAPSLLGVLVNPKYGPWIALRAALLIDRDIDQAGAAADFDPCPGCGPRTCIAACPAGAVDAAGWNPFQCMEHRVEVEADCAPRCHSRAACVLAPEARYPEDEIRYHQERALRTMRAYYHSRKRPARE